MSVRVIGVVVVLLAGAFGAGFAVGRGMLGELKTRYADVKSEADSLRDHLDEAKVRGELVDAMAGLREVALDVTDNNFGDARKVMVDVRATVQNAYEHAAHNESLRTSLVTIQQKLSEIDADLRGLDDAAREKIDALVDELRRIVGQ